MMNNVLIHVKNNELLNNYISIIEGKEKIKPSSYSKEIKEMIDEFYEAKWGVYLTTIENFKENEWKDIYFVNSKQKMNMNIKLINDTIDFMIIRNLGSVEGNFKMISNYLDYIIKEYKGIALNNPVSMKIGMTKKYLVDIDENIMTNIGMNIIPTRIYDNKIKYNELRKEYHNLNDFIIKPLTGELSNSLNCLNNIDEDFLRKKENKVGGWVIQPIKKEIWNGEYQFVYVGEKLIYAQKKNYPKKGKNDIPNQKDRTIEKYKPSEVEIKIGNKVIDYFKELYKIKIDICRIDFMKNSIGQPILIEFEMVNPGFFIGYMKEDDKEIKKIVREIREYCENYNKK